MRPTDRKYVVSAKPVNRRTASPRPPEPVPDAVRARLHASHARQRLGLPLRERLVLRGKPRPTDPILIASGVALAAGLTLLGLGGLQGHGLLGLAGGCLAAAGAVLMAWRRWRHAPETPPITQAIFDPADLERLDACLARLAPALSPQAAVEVKFLKDALARLAHLPPRSEMLPGEDVLYLRESVRRYLPDSLRAYDAVPGHRRHEIGTDGESADSLLASQLGLLRREIETREQRLAHEQAEALRSQQRFLQAKARSGGGLPGS